MKLVRRSHTIYIRKRVPRRYQSVDDREHLWLSLHTDSDAIAKIKAPVIWAEMIEAWEAKLAGSTVEAEGRIEAARELAAIRGYRYLASIAVAKLPIDQVLARVEKVITAKGKLDKQEADALLGAGPPPEITISRALELYWGLGDDAAISARFPRLVHCRITGFGEGGPLGGLPGYDAVAQAMSGLMSVNGPEGGAPVRIGIPVVDLATGLNAALGVMMALFERTKSGKGQFLEVALQDAGMSLLHPFLANYHIDGRIAKQSGNSHPNITPYDSFQTATVQVFLGVGNDGQFAKLCQFLGRSELASDPRFLTNASRTLNRPALRVLLETHLAKHDGVALAESLMKLGVPCGPVLDIGQVANHPHTQYRGMLVEMDDYKGTAAPVRLSRTPASYRRKPPKFGQHNAEILGKPPASS